MPIDWLLVSAAAWAVGCAAALLRVPVVVVRALLALGCLVGIAGAVLALPGGTLELVTGIHLGASPVSLRFAPDALWLMGFGLAPAGLAVALGTPATNGRRAWLLGVGLSLLGAFGVFGLQDAAALLVAWELMSLGGAVMLLAERLGHHAGQANLFMLALLEVGAVALLLALVLLAHQAGGQVFAGFGTQPEATLGLSGPAAFGLGVLLLVGFGAKLGLLPFYEWYPQAYGVGSGASGAVLSGVVLNAAYFGLSRALLDWLPPAMPWAAAFGTLVVALGVFTAILAILYAFQQDDWRTLLAFSSAENAAVAVTMLGASLLFRADGQSALAALAWTVALLHLGGHALAKGALFLAADGAYHANRSYSIAQSALLHRSNWLLGVGALFAAMSLAAMPPQAGFVSEWFAFQTLFQNFHLSSLGGRLSLALAGAGLALTAAIALASFVKLFGLGLLGAGERTQPRAPARHAAAVGALGLAVLGLAVGMLRWIDALGIQAQTVFGVDAPAHSHTGWILVPLHADFAFISPALLVIVMPLLALVPLALLLNLKRHAVRRVPVWWGGTPESAAQSATTALSFSNAMRTFYSFVYRPALRSRAEHRGQQPYFVNRLIFNYRIAPLFGPTLFLPATRAVWWLAGKFRALQSGDLNLYLAFIGFLLVGILALSLF